MRHLPALSLLVLALNVAAAPPTARFEPGTPVRHGHAHNDYEHARPLFDALSHGFCSIEADIYLRDGKLLVGHDEKDLTPERTLENLYLQPLLELAERNHGWIYTDRSPVILLVDIKSDAESTYAALKPVLARFESILTRFTPEGTIARSVTVILSGNRPRETLLREPNRLAAFDGRLDDLGRGLPTSFMPLVSDNFQQRFPSAKSGKLGADDAKAFHEAIEAAHREHRLIRFWAAKDDAKTWNELLEAGVDLINTDDLDGLSKFLQSAELRKIESR